jgi:hypothetical protein
MRLRERRRRMKMQIMARKQLKGNRFEYEKEMEGKHCDGCYRKHRVQRRCVTVDYLH